MMRTALAYLSGLLLSSLSAQVDSVEMRFAATITQADLYKHLEVLANDSLEGRETGEIGQRKAADYIVAQFRGFGIQPIKHPEAQGLLADGYQQQFPLEVSRLGGLTMEVDDRTYDFLKDYFYFSEHLLTNLDLAEVMVLTPLSLGGVRLGGAADAVMLLGDQASGRMPKVQTEQVMDVLEKAGTKVLLLVNDSTKSMMRQYGPYLAQGRMRLALEGEQATATASKQKMQVLMVTPQLAQVILDQGHLSMKKAYKTAARKRVVIKVPLKFSYAPRIEKTRSENVLGYVEGTDKKGEVVVVTAHYDHIGVIDGEVHNGADDDGSGTVAVLEMAQAFALAKAGGHGPRRSLLFMTVSGEEKGLLGSAWYADHPVFPMDSTVANLNMDMIGRTDSVHGDSSKYVYVIGSRRISNELGAIVEQGNAKWTHLELDYTFDADSDPNRFYYRSDHYNFAKYGVPIAFFFNGVHADYHGPYDELDKIRFDLLQQRTLLVFHTAWELANREARIVKNSLGQ